MQIRGRAPPLAQYLRTMARVGLFLRGRPELACKKNGQRNGDSYSTREQREDSALSKIAGRELFPSCAFDFRDALVALMPWLGVIRGMEKGGRFGRRFGG